MIELSLWHLGGTAGLAMFGLGTTEIIIIVVVALIFIGPAKLPQLAQQIGRGMRDIRRVSDDFQRELMRSQYEAERKATDTDDRTVPRPNRPAPVTQDAAAEGEADPPEGEEPILGNETHGDGASAGYQGQNRAPNMPPRRAAPGPNPTFPESLAKTPTSLAKAPEGTVASTPGVTAPEPTPTEDDDSA